MALYLTDGSKKPQVYQINSKNASRGYISLEANRPKLSRHFDNRFMLWNAVIGSITYNDRYPMNLKCIR